MTLWIRYEKDGKTEFGALDDDGRTVRPHRGDLFDDPRPTGETLPLDSVRLLTPVLPGKYLALWNNYHELAAGLGQAIPETPLYLVKTPNSYLEPEGSFRKPAGYEGKVVFEGELGIVIGRACSNVDETQAEAAIFGYTCVNDVTAFDLLNADPSFAQWVRAKGCDGFGPFGPAIATGLDWRGLRIRTLVGGRERQNYPASDMILPPARIVSLISREMTLLPGDLIACGTSVGVLPMRPGSVVEVAIDGIGTLRNTYEANNNEEKQG